MAAKDGNKKKNGQEQQERIYMNEEVDKNTGLEGEIGQVNFENKSDEWNVAMVEKREREKLKNMVFLTNLKPLVYLMSNMFVLCYIFYMYVNITCTSLISFFLARRC